MKNFILVAVLVFLSGFEVMAGRVDDLDRQYRSQFQTYLAQAESQPRNGPQYGALKLENYRQLHRLILSLEAEIQGSPQELAGLKATALDLNRSFSAGIAADFKQETEHLTLKSMVLSGLVALSKVEIARYWNSQSANTEERLSFIRLLGGILFSNDPSIPVVGLFDDVYDLMQDCLKKIPRSDQNEVFGRFFINLITIASSDHFSPEEGRILVGGVALFLLNGYRHVTGHQEVLSLMSFLHNEMNDLGLDLLTYNYGVHLFWGDKEPESDALKSDYSFMVSNAGSFESLLQPKYGDSFQHPFFYSFVGFLYNKMGQRLDAIRIYEASLERFADNTNFVNLSELFAHYARLGRKPQIIALLPRLLELEKNPQFAEKEKLKNLRVFLFFNQYEHNPVGAVEDLFHGLRKEREKEGTFRRAEAEARKAERDAKRKADHDKTVAAILAAKALLQEEEAEQAKKREAKGGKASKSGNNRGGAAGPSNNPRGGAAGPSNNPRGGAAGPSNNPRGGAAGPSSNTGVGETTLASWSDLSIAAPSSGNVKGEYRQAEKEKQGASSSATDTSNLSTPQSSRSRKGKGAPVAGLVVPAVEPEPVLYRTIEELLEGKRTILGIFENLFLDIETGQRIDTLKITMKEFASLMGALNQAFDPSAGKGSHTKVTVSPRSLQPEMVSGPESEMIILSQTDQLIPDQIRDIRKMFLNLHLYPARLKQELLRRKLLEE